MDQNVAEKSGLDAELHELWAVADLILPYTDLTCPQPTPHSPLAIVNKYEQPVNTSLLTGHQKEVSLTTCYSFCMYHLLEIIAC